MTNCGDPLLGKTRLLAQPCRTCILRPVGQRLDLSNTRITEFVKHAVTSGVFVVCHLTLPGAAPPGVEPAVCRGFADAFDTPLLRLIRALWGFVEVPVPDVSDAPLPAALGARTAGVGVRPDPQQRRGSGHPVLPDGWHWRYLPGHRCLHALDQPDARMARCGVHERGRCWRGEASRVERDHAAMLPLCGRCTQFIRGSGAT